MTVGNGSGVGGLRPLARGPVATVYAGRSTGTGTEVAVKMYAERIDRQTRTEFDRERAALDALRPVRSILPVDGIVEDAKGRWGVRMELCRGSLAGRLEPERGLPVREVVGIGLAMAGALAAAHAAGVLHGGITPHNVLYRASGEVALADFGLALRQRFPRDPILAVEYTAPETLREDTRSAESDLYALGAVLYTTLTGRPPFPRQIGQQPGERILQVLREEVRPIRVPGAPVQLSDVVGRLLAKDPADRPKAAAGIAELCANLLRFLPEAGADEVDFDDFAELPTRPGQPGQPARPAYDPPTEPIRLHRTLIHVVNEKDEPDQSTKDSLRRGPRRVAVLVGVVAVAGLVAVPAILFGGGSTEPGHAMPMSGTISTPVSSSDQPPSPSDVHLVVAPPNDEGNAVQLSWNADAGLDFAVVVAGDRIGTDVLYAGRDHTLKVTVDPNRSYCFQVRATDGQRIYTSDPVAIRGARCHP